MIKVSNTELEEHALFITLALTVLSLAVLLSITIGAAIENGGPFAYVTNSADSTVSVINTANNNIEATVIVGKLPFGLTSSPDGKKIYVVNYLSNNVSVIDTTTNSVTASVDVGSLPFGTAVSPDGTKVYVANSNSNNVSVIDTTKKTVPASMNVGKLPVSIGKIVMPFTSSTPVANFSSNVSNGYVPLAVKFTDLSKNATGWRWDFRDGLWRWDFGDGNNSTRKNTINTYPVAGNYTVNLTVNNANGTNSKTIKISVLKKEEISTS